MKEKILYIWLQQALGFYSRLVNEVMPRFSSINELYNCDDFSFLGEKREKYIKRLESKDMSSAFEIMKRCENLGVRVTGYYDELYPELLRSIESPPVVLYSIGEFKKLNGVPCVAIVGTRKMSDYGRETAENFAYNFAKSGAVVVSGLAKGVDTAAHRGAVMADGYTVAVLGNPIGDIYPRENEKAFLTLYKRGLVVSELYPGAPRTRADFPNRNRIISGICNSVVIAEAGENSGALITARHAIAQGKSVFAVPGAIGAENAGTNSLIKTGVPAATEPYDVLAPLALEFPEKLHPYEPSVTSKLRSYGNVFDRKDKKQVLSESDFETESITLKSTEQPLETASVKSDAETSGASAKIIAVLTANNPLTADEIVSKTGLPISTVMTELTFMEISGDIVSSAGGRFSAVK